MPLVSDEIPEITIKFYNEKIKPEAVIQFIASYQYVQGQNIKFEMELIDKIVKIEPAKILYFAIYNFNLGYSSREIPILVQENITSKYITKNYLTRKELSQFAKLIAKEGFVFDNYESNFKILDIKQEHEKDTYYCSYIDMFQMLNYDALKGLITKILVGINKQNKKG